MKLKDKKLLIFDLDGTLIDSSLDLSVAVNLMLKNMGLKEYEEEVIKGWVGNGAEVLVKRALSGKREYDKNLDEKKVKQALEIFLNHYQNNLAVKTEPYKGVLESLRVLKSKGYKLGIITNKPLRFVEPLLKKLGLDGLFDLIFGGDSFEVKKPHPKPLFEMLKFFDYKADEAVMIGDSKNDIVAAKEAGIESVAVSYGYNYDEDIRVYEPDFVIDEFGEILSLFAPKVAIIGGGVAGSSAALYLTKANVDVTLFEKERSLISGPPFCHLHSGGNLYPELPLNECLKLLEQSIEFAKLYPFAIDFRPTILAFAKREIYSPSDYFDRVEKLKKRYEELIEQDSSNNILGSSQNYYKLYSKEELERLKGLDATDIPKSYDEWMINFAKYVDLDKLKFPVIVVAEFGINLFRVASGAMLALKDDKRCSLRLKHEVKSIEEVDGGYLVDGEFFDYIINSTGYKSGEIDRMLGFKRDRFVEFKAAYITKWNGFDGAFAEVIFHGKRGSKSGMGQFTPYPNGYFQLHGMTKEITLFENSLCRDGSGFMPKIPDEFKEILDSGWDEEEVVRRTKRAIEHLSYFIPQFKDADVASKPLYGAQQIPGDNPELRAYEVSFQKQKRYARCEIVKVSSVVDMSREIARDLKSYGYSVDDSIDVKDLMPKIEKHLLEELSKEVAKERGYPKDMAMINYPTLMIEDL